MDKIVVEVYAPSIDKSYDFVLPCYMCVGEIGKLVGKAIAEQEDMPFDFQNIVVFDSDEGAVLDESLYIAETKVKDGTRLTII